MSKNDCPNGCIKQIMNTTHFGNCKCSGEYFQLQSITKTCVGNKSFKETKYV